MKLKDFKRRSVAYYKVSLDPLLGGQHCLYLRGPIGIGKTETICSVPPLLGKVLGGNYGCVVISGPLLNPPDTVGYLMPEKRAEFLASMFTKPFWWFTEEGKHLGQYDGGIIFVDEADKMDTDIKKCIGEAALSGRLGPHRLPRGWVVWMAGNRASDRSGSTKELDHLINRRHEIEIEHDMEGWTDWAFEHDVSPVFITFAQQHPQCVFADKVPDKQGPWCTPRSLVRCDRVMRQFADSEGRLPTDGLAIEDMSGIIGRAETAQLMATIKLEHEMPKYADIVRSPSTAKLPTKPDAQMLVCYSLAARVTEKDVNQVVDYVERLPKEFSVTFARAATKRDTNLVETSAFSNWCCRNASLMAAISDSR